MITTRHDEMEDAAWAFHTDYPNVYVLFDKFTREKIRQGFTHYSATGVFQRIRWETELPTPAPDDFKLNNNHCPFYSRWWMDTNPQHEGFFRTRLQISKLAPALHRPALGLSFFEKTYL